MADVPLTAETQRPVEGVLWMIACGLAFVCLTGIIRAIGTDLPAAQQAFLRFAFGVLLLAPTLRGILRAGFPPGAMRLFGARGVVHVAAVICWFYAMARLPVAEVTAIGYLNPVAVMLGGALVFGERLTAARLATVAAALVGAVIILRPGLRELGSGQAAQIVAALCFSGSYLFARAASRMMPAGTVVAMLSVTATLGLLPVALWVWQPVSLMQAAMLAGTAVLGTFAHYAMTRAFAAAPLAVTQPVTFLQIVWASLMGVLVFGEPVDPFVILGGAVIIAAISAFALKEARGRSRPMLPPEA